MNILEVIIFKRTLYKALFLLLNKNKPFSKGAG